MNQSRSIVITGVARGLGRAMAERFIALGHRVAGCSRDAAMLDKLGTAQGKAGHFSQVDVADDHQVAAWAKRVLAEFGTPDLLLNNAAIINRSAPLWELSAAEFDPVIDINIKGVTNVLRQFIPAMIGAGRGVIVNFSSGWGRSVSPEVAPYCATKWAIEGMTRALAEELPRGIAAVPLNPGVINTEMLQSCWGEGASSFPNAAEWAERAVPFLLKLGPKDNGRPLTVS
ncbi:MAG TPA: oxidoreductase [Verrucomicrobiales bacterium]|nr:oxidoreductase [Verrucomicrobiales bacterium]